MSYKIKINCTSHNELSFKDRKINNHTFKEFRDIKYPQYIYRLNFVTRNVTNIKRNEDFTIKYLEFMCDRLVEDKELIEFIKYMKLLGCDSKNNNKVSLIKSDNNTYISEYYFNSLKESKINKKPKNPYNKSIYKQKSIKIE